MKNDGRNFETNLQTCCRIYHEAHRAYFQKLEPPTRTLGFGPARRVIYLKNPFLDFTGVLASGRSVHFEAKSTSEDKTLPAGGNSGLSDTQWQALQDWRAAGAMAFLLWERQGQVQLFFECMIAAALEERKSLVWGNGLDVPQGMGFLIYDFLKVVYQHPELA